MKQFKFIKKNKRHFLTTLKNVSRLLDIFEASHSIELVEKSGIDLCH